MFGSCSHKQDSKNSFSFSNLKKLENKWFKTCSLFNDTNYIFTLTTIDTTYSIEIGRSTVIVNLIHLRDNRIDTLINDSLFCRNSILANTNEYEIEFGDYNFDGTKDIILPAGTDPRSNYGLHLYIVDNDKKEIKYVDGFQEIGNPEPDIKNKIIISTILSGQVFTNFYTFNLNNDLIDLGHTFIFKLNKMDPIEYDRNFKKVIKGKQYFDEQQKIK